MHAIAAHLLTTEPGYLLLAATLLGMSALPAYILWNVQRLAQLPAGTRGWTTTHAGGRRHDPTVDRRHH
jgi:hypothetical protein